MQFRCVGGVVAIVLALASGTRGENSRLRFNSVGFLTDSPKRATVAGECSIFRVIRESDGAEVFAASTLAPVHDNDTGESVTVIDFSSVRDAGVYRLEVPGIGRSPPFPVGPAIYREPYRVAMRAMYLWRCGTAVNAEHAGDTFAHAACHLDDARLDFVGAAGVKKDLTGGWHDAGDYNKYVVNAGFSLGVLFQAWDHFGAAIGGVSLDIPESSNRTPDFLDELRWEVEWVLKMHAEDGRVYHKVSTTKFGGFIMPEAEKAERFVTPWSSAATADFAAVTAMAARHFRAHDPELADRCLAAARRSYAFLASHPDNHPADLTGFSTGTYQANDGSRRLWAAVELWETTGEPQFLLDFESRAAALERKVDPAASWANVKNLAIYTYVLSKRQGRDPALLESVKSSLLAAADDIVKTASTHAYARPLGSKYFWGCNGDAAQQVQTLHVADRVRPNPVYVSASLDALGHLFGRNPYGRSFVTGVGYRPPMHPHDRRSGADAARNPWPGYLIGGGWPKASDWQDVQDSYRTNEIAINWNATLIYALARFVSPPSRR